MGVFWSGLNGSLPGPSRYRDCPILTTDDQVTSKPWEDGNNVKTWEQNRNNNDAMITRMEISIISILITNKVMNVNNGVSRKWKRTQTKTEQCILFSWKLQSKNKCSWEDSNLLCYSLYDFIVWQWHVRITWCQDTSER